MFDVLENGPWMIRNMPIFLNKWNPDICVTKENLTKVPLLHIFEVKDTQRNISE